MKFNIKKSVMLASIIIGALWISGCATSTPAPVAPINKAIDIPKDTIAGCITGEQIEQIDLSHMLQNFSGVSSMENSLKAYDSEKQIEAYGMFVTKENNTTYNINYINKRKYDHMSIFPVSDYTIINVIMFPLHLTSFFTEYMIRQVIFEFEPSSTVSYTFDIAKLSDTQIKVSLNTNPTIKRTGAYHYIYPSYYDTYKVRKAGVMEERDIKQTAKENIEKIFNAFPSTITDYLNKNGDKFHEALKALYMNNVFIGERNYGITIDPLFLDKIMIKNGYKRTDKVAYEYYKKTIIDNKHSLISKVTTKCIASCSINISQHIDNSAHSGDGCFPAPNIFNETSEKEMIKIIDEVNPFLTQAYKVGKNHKKSELGMMYKKCVSTLYDEFGTTFDATKDTIKKIQTDEKDIFVLKNITDDKEKTKLIKNKEVELNNIVNFKKLKDRVVKELVPHELTIGDLHASKQMAKMLYEARISAGQKANYEEIFQKLLRESKERKDEVYRTVYANNEERFYDMLKSFAHITDDEISKYGNDTLKEYVECGRIGKAIDLKD